MRSRLFIALAIGLAIAWSGESSAQTNLQLEALKRLKNIDIESNPALKKIVLKSLEAAKGTPVFVEIVRDFKLKGHEAALIRFAQAHPKESTGVEAMRLALTEPGLKLVADAVNGTEAKAALATTEALANAQFLKAEPILLSIVKDSKKPLALRTVAVNGLAKTKTGTKNKIKIGCIRDLLLLGGGALAAIFWGNLP